MKEFSQQLKKIMKARGISQVELCERTGIPKSAMSQYISGTFKPKQERTYLLAKALDTTPEYLMGLTEDPQAPASSTANTIELKSPVTSEVAKITYSNSDELISMMKEIFKCVFHIPDSELQNLTIFNVMDVWNKFVQIPHDEVNEENLLKLFHSLNNIGKIEAFRQVEQLTRIKEYQQIASE